MAFDEGLAQRVREILAAQDDVVEKKMFGGLAFMVAGHMCCGVVGEDLMARVGPGQYASALQHPCTREMDFTGKPLKGFVYVGHEGIAADDELTSWVARCLQFVTSLPPR